MAGGGRRISAKTTAGASGAGPRLIAIPSEQRADELAAELHAEMPWMGPATEAVWHAMRASVRASAPGFRLPPLLLDGPPGIGKSTWAQRLASLIGTATMQIDAASEAAGFAVAGCQRGWSSAAPGRPLELILRQRIGNPIIVVDEVEKPGRVTSAGGLAHGLTDALLGPLEPVMARGWACPYFRVTFDMGWIGWVMTSNDWRHLSPPFLSRCRLIRLGPPHARRRARLRREGSQTPQHRGRHRGDDLRSVGPVRDPAGPAQPEPAARSHCRTAEPSAPALGSGRFQMRHR
ncbi:AAA family ATPase [Ostreiculturibacter nitratireducens]|uniref:AAA family ATPase n=1 Tax=Ostreiculturibacter nitratireducens TaxID=3075226 RepID=UPI0031B62D85